MVDARLQVVDARPQVLEATELAQSLDGRVLLLVRSRQLP